MPVYGYRCTSCGVQFERQQSFQDAPLKTCPECRKRTLVKVLAPVGIVFKGSGFYATDNRSGSTRSSSTKKKDDSKASDDSGAATTEKAASTKAESTE
jgi:putative FmdB family regulatory protein